MYKVHKVLVVVDEYIYELQVPVDVTFNAAQTYFERQCFKGARKTDKTALEDAGFKVLSQTKG